MPDFSSSWASRTLCKLWGLQMFLENAVETSHLKAVEENVVKTLFPSLSHHLIFEAQSGAGSNPILCTIFPMKKNLLESLWSKSFPFCLLVLKFVHFFSFGFWRFQLKACKAVSKNFGGLSLQTAQHSAKALIGSSGPSSPHNSCRGSQFG